MRRRPTTPAWLLCCAALFTACATPPARTVIVPPGMTTCPKVEVPDPESATQRDVALLLADLWAAHAICRERLHKVVGLVGDG